MSRLPIAVALVLVILPAAMASGADVQILVGRSVVGTHTEGVVVTTPDTVSTAVGRAEILFADGALLHVDADTRVRWAAAGPLTLDEGRILLKSGMGGWLEVVLPFARVTLAPGGSYGFLVDASHGRLLVSVAEGSADLRTSAAQATLPSSRLAVLTDESSRIVATSFEPAPWDTFLRWSRARVSALVLSARQPDARVASATVIPLGPGGFQEPGPVSGPAPSYTGGDVIWYGGSAVLGWPVPRGGGARERWDRRADPYAPRYEPHYEPRPYGGAREPGRPGREGMRRTGPAIPAPAPRELPPAIPPTPAQTSRPARGGAGRLPWPGALPTGARPPDATASPRR